MKNIYRMFIALFCIGVLASCETEYDLLDQGFDLDELPAYVAFDAPGNTINLDAESATEGDEVVFTIENPTGTLSDITVNYEFGGSAEFGTDFMVEGASASGGSIVLDHDPRDFQFLDNVDLVVNLLTDGVTDGDKSLTITLVSAVNAEGSSLAVGRGGTDFLKTATINISDADCASDLAGNYLFDITGDLGEAEGLPAVITEADGNGNYVIDDFAAGAFGEAVPYEFSVACGVVSGPAMSTISEGVSATITGTADEEAKTIVMNVVLNCCGGEGSEYTLNLTRQ